MSQRACKRMPKGTALCMRAQARMGRRTATRMRAGLAMHIRMRMDSRSLPVDTAQRGTQCPLPRTAQGGALRTLPRWAVQTSLQRRRARRLRMRKAWWPLLARPADHASALPAAPAAWAAAAGLAVAAASQWRHRRRPHTCATCGKAAAAGSASVPFRNRRPRPSGAPRPLRCPRLCTPFRQAASASTRQSCRRRLAKVRRRRAPT
mmetsp:Transcript_20182/g.59911  ORF Transcript_20182/g.59911 Transcript_20182/m.59911 type:complete len:206 (+) Transcript_20182:2225-2842(+)